MDRPLTMPRFPGHRCRPRHRRPRRLCLVLCGLSGGAGRPLESALAGGRGDAPRWLMVSADVTSTRPVERLSRLESTWGPIDVLVVNAGAALSAPLVKTTDEDWPRMLDLNLTAPFRCIRRALPSMRRAGGAGSWSSPRSPPRAAGPHRRVRREQARRTRPGAGGSRRVRAHRRHRQRDLPRLRRHPDDRRVGRRHLRGAPPPRRTRAVLANAQPIGRLIDPGRGRGPPCCCASATARSTGKASTSTAGPSVMTSASTPSPGRAVRFCTCRPRDRHDGAPGRVRPRCPLTARSSPVGSSRSSSRRCTTC